MTPWERHVWATARLPELTHITKAPSHPRLQFVDRFTRCGGLNLCSNGTSAHIQIDLSDHSGLSDVSAAPHQPQSAVRDRVAGEASQSANLVARVFHRTWKHSTNGDIEVDDRNNICFAGHVLFVLQERSVG